MKGEILEKKTWAGFGGPKRALQTPVFSPHVSRTNRGFFDPPVFGGFLGVPGGSPGGALRRSLCGGGCRRKINFSGGAPARWTRARGPPPEMSANSEPGGRWRIQQLNHLYINLLSYFYSFLNFTLYYYFLCFLITSRFIDISWLSIYFEGR